MKVNPGIRILVADEASTLVDADKMKQVVLNLVHNAIQHTDAKSGEIGLALQQSGQDQVELCVQDNGAGIASEHIASVFDRFYRSDEEEAY